MFLTGVAVGVVISVVGLGLGFVVSAWYVVRRK